MMARFYSYIEKVFQFRRLAGWPIPGPNR